MKNGGPKLNKVAIPDGMKCNVMVCDYYGQTSKGGHGVDTAFSNIPGAKITAVVDPDKQSRRILQDKVKAPNRYSDYREAIDKEKPDIVCVCSRLPGNHKDTILYAAGAGCHLYCEKPLAIDLHDSDDMIQAVEEAHVRLAVAHLGRYWPALQKAKQLLQRGDIGRLLSVYCRGREDERGGGEDMMVLGTHVLDLARFFAGDPLSVYGNITREGRTASRDDAHEPTEPLGPVAGDEIVALYTFPNGVTGFFESRKDMEQSTTDYRMGITVVGTEGSLQFRYTPEREVRLRKTRCPLEANDSYESIEPPLPTEINDTVLVPESSKDLQGYFLICNQMAALDLMLAIAEEREPLCNGKDARWALEMTHGVYRSHFSNRAETFPAANRKHPLV